MLDLLIVVFNLFGLWEKFCSGILLIVISVVVKVVGCLFFFKDIIVGGFDCSFFDEFD